MVDRIIASLTISCLDPGNILFIGQWDFANVIKLRILRIRDNPAGPNIITREGGKEGRKQGREGGSQSQRRRYY